jgi:hypothetical protein
MPDRPTRPPIIRARDFYQPPPTLPAHAWDLLPPAERAISWYEHKAQRRLPRPQGVDLAHPLYARIDAGRWIAECPCRSAQVVSPDDPRMFCVECLTPTWYRLIFPKDVDAAEQAVADKAPRDQFWWHPDDDQAWNKGLDDQPEPLKQPLVLPDGPGPGDGVGQ